MKMVVGVNQHQEHQWSPHPRTPHGGPRGRSRSTSRACPPSHRCSRSGTDSQPCQTSRICKELLQHPSPYSLPK